MYFLHPTPTPTPPAPPAFRTAAVIANPIAGKGRGRASAERLAAGLRQTGIDTELLMTGSRGDASRMAAERSGHVDLVVSVGGDGTLNEVLSGIADGTAGPSRTAIAQLPFGTANVLATELRLPNRVDRAVEVIRNGRTTLLDTAEVNGRLSFLCVGIGIDGYAVREVEKRRTGAISKLFYVEAMARVLRHYKAPQLQLEVDGEVIDGDFGFVLISNVRGYGAVFRLSEDCQHADERVEVYALRRGTPVELLRMAANGVVGLLPGRAAHYWQAERVRVTGATSARVPYQVDGDFGGVGDVDYRVSDFQARIVVP
ncbi:MAG: diacylglycerol kinase family protein [Planctomycetota bacterium]